MFSNITLQIVNILQLKNNQKTIKVTRLAKIHFAFYSINRSIIVVSCYAKKCHKCTYMKNLFITLFTHFNDRSGIYYTGR